MEISLIHAPRNAELSASERLALAFVELDSRSSMNYIKASPEKLLEMENLLVAGADPNLIICRYRMWDGKEAHRLLSPGSDTQLLEYLHYQHLVQFEQNEDPLTKIYAVRLQFAQEDPWLETRLCHIISPLTHAVDQNDRNAVTLLARFGASFTTCIAQIQADRWAYLDNPLLSAIVDLDSHFVQRLLELATPGNDLVMRWTGECLTTLFSIAGSAEDGPTDVETTLLHYGVDFRHFCFPLHLSQKYIDTCIQNSILRDVYGFTPLHVAVGDATAKLALYLITKHENINATDIYGMSPLLEAVYYGHFEVVCELISHGANVNLRASDY
jgi:ankyrin repeat protein